MNQYRVRKSLGQGSFGRVVEALDIEDKTKGIYFFYYMILYYYNIH